MNFERLDRLMLEKRVSNVKLGEYVGTSDTIVGRWRRGEAIPRSDNLARIAVYLGCSSDYLLGLSDVMNVDGADTALMLQGDEAKLMGRFRELDDEGKEEVLHTALAELRRMRADRGEGTAAVG